MMANKMWKRLGFSSAALCAALAFVQPQTAAAQDRDDYRYNARSSFDGHEYRERLARERRERELRERERREHIRFEHEREWARFHDRDDYGYRR